MSDDSAGVPTCLLIPPVAAFDLGDWAATSHAMSAGVRLEFGQPWFAAREADFRPGCVWLGVQGDALIIYGVLEDEQPANRATQWNDHTWMTGDVLEFFFQAEGRPGYYEFHVTPENCRLQLFFSSSAAFRQRRRFEDATIAESRFESAAYIHASRTCWEAVMRVPLSLVLDEPRSDGSRRFKFLLSRYDYQPGRMRPVTSTTVTGLNGPDFHNTQHWAWAEAARG